MSESDLLVCGRLRVVALALLAYALGIAMRMGRIHLPDRELPEPSTSSRATRWRILEKLHC